VSPPRSAAAATASGPPAWPDPEIGHWQSVPPREAGEPALRCWLALPPEGRARAGVLVLPEIFGLNPWVRSVAGRLALAGYAALAVPLYGRTAPTLDLGYDGAAVQEGRAHKERTSAATLLADVARAADWLAEQRPELPPGLGCVGFCFGGHAAMLAASLPQLRATCDFYGAGVVSGRPGGGPPTLDGVASLPGRLLCVCGLEDPLIPPSDVAAIEAALATANAHRPQERAHLVRTLEAGHGFLCEARADFRPEAAAEAWQAMLAFFGESLG
jgi:carboxymethylenebutenolidase